MKQSFLIFILLYTLNICQAQNTEFLQEKSSILKNHSSNLRRFAKIAHVIDSDDESFWAYEYADSILSTIDASGKNYFKDLSKVNSAYMYILYGMSYTKTIYAISRGDKYSLQELSATIHSSSNISGADLYNLSKGELASIYSMINFYKVGRMPKYEDMYTLFQTDSLNAEEIFRKYSPETAYRIVSLRNKKLYFQTFVNLIIDIYSINNPNVDKSEYENYINQLRNLADEMDRIPSQVESVTKQSDKAYFDCVVRSSSVQKTMLYLLVNEISELKNHNK